MKIISFIIKLIIAMVFISGALLKLFPVEPFEIHIFSLNIFSFNVSSIFARLIISIELFLGLILILAYNQKSALKIIITLLSIFTVYLFYELIFVKSENCFCFGDKFKLTAFQSIIKNILLIATCIFLIRKNYTLSFKYQKQLAIIILIFSLSFPFIISPPDKYLRSIYSNSNFEKPVFPVEMLKTNTSDFSKGRKLICFLSTHCDFCKLAATKISLTKSSSFTNKDVLYLFFNDTNDISNFYKKSKSEKYEFKTLNVDTFFMYSGNSFPAIFFTENGKVVSKYGYRNLMDEDIINFFENR